MIPNPLHPAVVHFPVVLAFLLPLFVVGALWAIRRGARPRRAWLLPTAIAIALAGSSWLSVETGEAQSGRVERVVGEQAMDAHEDVAELFLTTAVGVAVLTAAGLVGGIAGRAARALAVAGSLATVGLVARVGHTGGQLVYKYGAAGVYTGAPDVASTTPSPKAGDGR